MTAPRIRSIDATRDVAVIGAAGVDAGKGAVMGANMVDDRLAGKYTTAHDPNRTRFTAARRPAAAPHPLHPLVRLRGVVGRARPLSDCSQPEPGARWAPAHAHPGRGH